MEQDGIIEEEIPRWEDGAERPTGLAVTVDGHPARAIIAAHGWSSERMILVFDPPHPEHGVEWMTKYFGFPEPGRLEWGHDGAAFEVRRAT